MNRSPLAVGWSLIVPLLASAAVARAAPADAEADVGARKPEVWAVVVGIDLYEDPAIPRCRGAKGDSGALARWFTETARWGQPHVLWMSENGPTGHGRPEEPIRALRPTRENLDWALTGWLGHRYRPGDVAVVYFAGRSAFVGGRERLLPFDARADDLGRTGWSPEDAVDELARRGPSSLLFWLDTAPMAVEGKGQGPAPDTAPGVRLLNGLTRWPGASAWRSFGRPEAVDDDAGDVGRGPFLSALADGLGDRPAGLVACLDRMLQDPALKRYGFRAQGGLAPHLSLWPGRLLPADQLRPALLLQLGHADEVTAVVASADGETTITASLDSTIRVWRIRQGVRALVRVLTYHAVGVTALALGADGRHVASGDGLGRVRVWDLAEHREKPRDGAPLHHQRVIGLAFLPGEDGARFVSLDQDGQTMLWDATGPRLEGKPLLPQFEVVRLTAARREGPAALALAEADGKLILLSGDGKPRRTLDGPGGRTSALHLAPDGRRVAAGDEHGGVRVWDVETGAVVFRHDYAAKVGTIRIGPSGQLAVGAGDRLYLASDRDRVGPGLALEGVEPGDEVCSALFSGDGRWLAALTAVGGRHAWDVADPSRPSARPLAVEGKSAGATSLEFARDGLGLVSGEGDGAVRGWDLPEGRERFRIAPHRGKVGGLSVSADGRFLLEVTKDGRALVWDLKEGRGATALPGRWASGAFLPDPSRLVLARDAGEGGEVVLVDREGGRAVPLERPRVRGGGEVSRVAFGRVAASGDGRTVAAAAAPGRGETVCLWDVRGGPPRVLRGHARTITALAFSGDGRSLLTASEDGTAKVWALAPDGPAPERPSVVFGQEKGRPITAAQVGPGDPARVVTADWSDRDEAGRVVLWDWQPGSPPRPRRLGELSQRAHALAFAGGGRWVAAAGQDKLISLWLLEGDRTTRVPLDPEHQHAEQVNALAAWSTAPMFASGGDDTTVRLWSLDAKARRGSLLGTLVAGPSAPGEDDAGRGGRGRPPDRDRFALAPATAGWVAFTPDGVYDSSLDGDRTVSFVVGEEVRPLEQYAGQFHRFQLTDDLRNGTRPPPPPYTPPPALAIDLPEAPDVRGREAELRITLADPSLGLDGLRLYQDGVPVQDGHDFRPLDGPGRFAATVRLRSGVNRFYAMAGRPGDVDARSRDVEIRHDGPEDPGRFHVLAIGVKDYTRNALRYASNDADGLADHLHRYGVEGAERPGEKIVLTDVGVTEDSVDDAFKDLRRAVKGHPEDTVVVFLAGHTDVLKDRDGRERFSLLLPSFPFPADAPALAANRGVGVAGAGPAGGRLPPGVDLPFYVIYRNLCHLDALRRLVIIDACQAEAIESDPRVRLIREVLEKDTHRARTSYLLAARRGEPANESAILEHGLLTYTLLRGMAAPGLRPLPSGIAPAEEPPNADEDLDGIVTTRELRRYADRMLPLLASRLPDLARRSGPDRPPPPPDPLRVQSSEGAAFPLARLPAARPIGPRAGD